MEATIDGARIFYAEEGSASGCPLFVLLGRHGVRPRP